MGPLGTAGDRSAGGSAAASEEIQRCNCACASSQACWPLLASPRLRPSAASLMHSWVRARRAAPLLAAVVAAVVMLSSVSVSLGDLGSREQSLQQAIGSQSARIDAYR